MANLVGVVPPARRTLIIEVPPDVIPTESANLSNETAFILSEKKVTEKMRDWALCNHLILALARLEVQIRDIHFLEAKGTLLRFLFESQKTWMYD